MLSKLQSIQKELRKLKDEASEKKQDKLQQSLAGACLFIRTACEAVGGEGKQGVQNSERKYASAREAGKVP